MNTKAFRNLSYGMYIVTSALEERQNGQIANTVFQITSDPATIAISINKQNYTHEIISESNVFAVSVLSENAPMTLIGQFGFKSGKDVDKLEGIKYREGKTKSPIILDSTVAYIEAKVINRIDMKTHTLFIAEIIDADVLSKDSPMTYAYYHLVKRGKSPKTAPTYIKEKEEEPKEVRMKKYRCTVCGYIYDPEKGDPDSGISPGTAFEDIPDDWTCPICGVSKSDFELMED